MLVVLWNHSTIVSVVSIPLIRQCILRVLVLAGSKWWLTASILRRVVGLNGVFVKRSWCISTRHHFQSAQGHLIFLMRCVLRFAVWCITTLIRLSDIYAVWERRLHVSRAVHASWSVTILHHLWIRWLRCCQVGIVARLLMALQYAIIQRLKLLHGKLSVLGFVPIHLTLDVSISQTWIADGVVVGGSHYKFIHIKLLRLCHWGNRPIFAVWRTVSILWRSGWILQVPTRAVLKLCHFDLFIHKNIKVVV